MATDMLFECGRCGQVLSSKFNLARHLQRPTICQPTRANVCRETLLTQLTSKPQNQHECKFGCGKTYVHKSNMYAHHRDCKLNPDKKDKPKMKDKDPKDQIINALLKQLQEINKNAHSTQYITTNNMHVNVTLPCARDFGSEDTSFITPSVLMSCLRNQSLVDLFAKMHIDPQHPQNHNVCVKKIKLKLCDIVEKQVVKK